MRVQITYMVPVEVVINTDEPGVQRVVVIDEEIRPDRDDLAPDGWSIHDGGYASIRDSAVRKHAREVAEDAMWPGWEFGW